MVEDWLQSVVAVIGAITGSVSLGIVVYKIIKDRPNLHFELGRCYYFSAGEHDNFHNISVEVQVHNKGQHNTTIYSSNLLIKNNGKEFDLTGSNYAFHVPQDSTVVQNFQFGLNKKEGNIEKELTDSTMKIKHTFGEATIKIQSIKNVN